MDLRQRVGMVFQRPNPFPQSIYDNVAFGPRVLGSPRRNDLDEIVVRALEDVGLWDELKDHLKRPALELNPGQQQRLCIARTIAVKPEIILMDEPCSALDHIATLHVEDLMRELAQHYTIVIVTHNMQQAARVSDRTGFFLAGQAGRDRHDREDFHAAQRGSHRSVHHRAAGGRADSGCVIMVSGQR